MRPAAVTALMGVILLAGCGDLFTSEDDGRKNHAVIVGISDYQSSALNLKWGEEDALDFYDALRGSKGWETDNITLLTNSSASRDAIKAALAGLAKRVRSDDTVVFYFSGRGSYGPDQPPFDEGDGLDEYLVPFDGQVASSSRDLSDDALEALVAALPTNNVLVILDAGFAGSTSRTGTSSDRGKCVLRSTNARSVDPSTVDGMSHELARPGYVFISSTMHGTAPRESNQLRNGVFTHYFVEGLQGAASPGRRMTTAQQAFQYSAPRTSAYEAGQAPQIIDRRGKNFNLTKR